MSSFSVDEVQERIDKITGGRRVVEIALLTCGEPTSLRWSTRFVEPPGPWAHSVRLIMNSFTLQNFDHFVMRSLVELEPLYQACVLRSMRGVVWSDGRMTVTL